MEKIINLENKQIEITIPIDQNKLEGLAALIHWLEGFRASGKGEVPGNFELIMHFRNLITAIENK